MAFCDPNPLASIAYASCLPHGVEPPFEDSALTSRAAYERLNRAAARAETLVLYRLDMLAGCRDSLDVDQTRLEASVQNLWRLTAVRKTLMAIESALNAPTPTPKSLIPALNDCAALLQETTRALAAPTGSADVPSATAPADPSAPASLTTPGPLLGPRTSSSASAPADQSPSSPAHSQPTPSTESTLSIPSMGPIGSIGSIPSIPPVPQSPSLQVSPSSSPHSALRAPHLSLRAVPACPRMSLSSVSRTLDRVNADMANYTVHTSTAADYDTNVTAEEFLRPALSPKSSPASAPDFDTAEDSDSPLLADPALSPSLKSQISIRHPGEKAQWVFETEIRDSSPCPQVSQSPSLPVSPSPLRPG